MKKLFLLIAISLFVIGCQIDAVDQENQQSDNDLSCLVGQAISDSASCIKQCNADQDYTIQSIDVSVILEQIKGGPEFLDLCKKTYQAYMLLDQMLKNDESKTEEEKAALLAEGYQEILSLQRHLRSQIEPLIRQQAIEDGVDLIFDSYTGALLYNADHMQLDRVTVHV